MMALIVYDVTDNRTRARLHRFLKEFGLNTQKSVFEGELSQEGLERIVAYARRHLDRKTDSLRIYGLCAACRRQVLISGQGLRLEPLDFVVV